MDLYKAIRTLYDEKKRLDGLIHSLELLQARGDVKGKSATRSRRGRKKMTPEQKQEVSERMRKYWASRKQKAAGESQPSPALAARPDLQN